MYDEDPQKNSLEKIASKHGYYFIDEASRHLLDDIAGAALSPASVLITGETGTGKEIVACLLHEMSGRRGRFVVVNCGAIPRFLPESLFFGHVAGAFTGANDHSEGYVQAAAGGTLFLDEIAEMRREHQAVLLRVLDGREYSPIGSHKLLKPNIRIVAATNRDLSVLCREGRFRYDLYMRLAIIRLEMPPIRDRPRDIMALAERRAKATQCGVRKPSVRDITGAVERLIKDHYEWPGGMREVISFVERASAYGVARADEQIRKQWSDNAGPVVDRGPIDRPVPGQRDREALAGLILSLWCKTRKTTEQSRSQSQGLADVLLGSSCVAIEDVARVLGRRDKRTLAGYLKPLVQARLVHVDEGDLVDPRRIRALWPPVTVALLRRQGNAWVPVPAGIPLMRSGEHLLVHVVAQIDVVVRMAVVTHRWGEVRERQSAIEPVAVCPTGTRTDVIARQAIPASASYRIARKLDSTPGFEQIIVHVSCPPHRGLEPVDDDPETPMAPPPHVRDEEQVRLLERWGPGWIRDFLVHHVE